MEKCAIDGCPNPPRPHGYCVPCRRRAWAAANPEKIRATKLKYREVHGEREREAGRIAAEKKRRAAGIPARQPAMSRDERLRREREAKAAQRAEKRARGEPIYTTSLENVRRLARKHQKQRRERLRGFEGPDMGHLALLPCARCGAEGPSAVDHILPLGWADLPEVRECLGQTWCYQPLCKSCNSSKGCARVEAYVPTGEIGD